MFNSFEKIILGALLGSLKEELKEEFKELNKTLEGFERLDIKNPIDICNAINNKYSDNVSLGSKPKVGPEDMLKYALALAKRGSSKEEIILEIKNL